LTIASVVDDGACVPREGDAMAGSVPAKRDSRGSDPASGWQVPCERFVAELKLAASVALHLEASQSAGETPDGVRLDLRVHGDIDGPMLNGKVPSLSAHMLVDVDGVGTLEVRAPFVLSDGAVLEIEATVRYDFGPDGYRRAAAGDLPDSVVAGCLRFLTGHPRYQWVNRAVCLGVGRLDSREKRIDYDVFVVEPKLLPGSASKVATGAAPDTPIEASLYERLGGRDRIGRIVDHFVDGLDTNVRLNRQNPRIAIARSRVNQADRKRKVADLLCKLTGGPCDYTGALREAHAPIALSEADWAIGGEELVKALNKQNVKKTDQDELLAMIETLKSDIVQRR
jgi:hemoglobin